MHEQMRRLEGNARPRPSQPANKRRLFSTANQLLASGPFGPARPHGFGPVFSTSFGRERARLGLCTVGSVVFFLREGPLVKDRREQRIFGAIINQRVGKV